jgi:hypothetical protein
MSGCGRWFAILLAVLATGRPVEAQPATDSAQASIAYLSQVMDEFHDRFPVYDDVSSPGNHFHVYAKLPDGGAPVTMNGSWTGNPHSGATSIRCQFTATAFYAGFYFQNGTLSGAQSVPQANWGTVPNAGVDLTGATALTFWARGETGGEQIDFFLAGVGRNGETGAPVESHPDSSPRRPAPGTLTTLTTSWQQFTIDLTGMDLSYVLGGFAWVATSWDNPDGATFYLDDIQYQLGPERLEARLNEMRFLRSFTTLPLQPDPLDANENDDIDFVRRNTAFIYDNALAILAFLAEGSTDSVRRAGLIGDAFVYATQHDRLFNDNHACNDAIDPLSVDGARLRSAYAAGDIAVPNGWTPNGRSGVVPIPGFYIEATKTFHEIDQEAIDVGNNAWAVVALRALYQRTAEASYLDAACRLANFIHSFRNDSGTYRGFRGGVNDPEETPALRPWASSEHNIDAYAAFAALYRATGDVRWQQDAEHARQFIEAMWEPGRNCFVAGTADPFTLNDAAGALPLDVQAWSVLAIPDVLAAHPGVLQCAETNHLTTADGFTGFDFNDDNDGVWFEGTAQMVVAYALAGQTANAETYREQLRNAQEAAFGDGEGVVAASHDGVSTGFFTASNDPFVYFRRLHVGATAWNVLAQLGVNPYYISLPAVPPAAVDARYTGTAAAVTWPPVAGAAGYDVGRSSNGQAYAVIASPVFASTTDASIAGGAAYLYRVRTRNLDGTTSAWSAPDVSTAVVFTDDPLAAGTIIRSAHVTQLRTAVNAVRTLAGLPAATFASATIVRAQHLIELRNAVGQARSALSLPALTYMQPVVQPRVTLVRAADVAELRDGVR